MYVFCYLFYRTLSQNIHCAFIPKDASQLSSHESCHCWHGCSSVLCTKVSLHPLYNSSRWSSWITFMQTIDERKPRLGWSFLFPLRSSPWLAPLLSAITQCYILLEPRETLPRTKSRWTLILVFLSSLSKWCPLRRSRSLLWWRIGGGGGGGGA